MEDCHQLASLATFGHHIDRPTTCICFEYLHSFFAADPGDLHPYSHQESRIHKAHSQWPVICWWTGTIIFTPLNAFGSGFFNKRAFFVWLPLTWTLILISIIYFMAVKSLWNRYALWTRLMNAGIATFHPVNGAWLSINSRTSQGFN